LRISTFIKNIRGITMNKEYEIIQTDEMAYVCQNRWG